MGWDYTPSAEFFAELEGYGKMLTTQLLEAYGYKYFEGGIAASLKSADGLFQKRVWSYEADGNCKDILYHINIWYYKSYETGFSSEKEAFQPEVQYIMNENRDRFEVLYLGEMDLNKIEAFFDRIYQRMNCFPEGD